MKIGIIGYGFRMKTVINSILAYNLGVEIKAITDIDHAAVKTRLQENNIPLEGVNFYTDADEMMDTEELDGVLIGTRCELHTPLALKVLKRDLPLFLEKPVATNMEDLILLRDAAQQSKSEVVVSFPLRVTPLVQLAKEIVDSGKLGAIEHVQAINNVPYGGVYYNKWYKDEKAIGGLFLQKATHDFDYINYLLGIKPITICAMKSKQIFKGDKPAGLSCKECEEYETCPESSFVRKHLKYEQVRGELCCFATDTGNQDSGSALIKYETGMHVSYSQNFFARKAAGTRGARLLGYNGTLEFDWYKDELKVFLHHTPRVETYQCDSSKMSHGGGDEALAYNFIRVMQGKEKSVAPLEDGLLSALMCIKANASAELNIYQNITWE